MKAVKIQKIPLLSSKKRGQTNDICNIGIITEILINSVRNGWVLITCPCVAALIPLVIWNQRFSSLHSTYLLILWTFRNLFKQLYLKSTQSKPPRVPTWFSFIWVPIWPGNYCYFIFCKTVMRSVLELRVYGILFSSFSILQLIWHWHKKALKPFSYFVRQ